MSHIAIEFVVIKLREALLHPVRLYVCTEEKCINSQFDAAIVKKRNENSSGIQLSHLKVPWKCSLSSIWMRQSTFSCRWWMKQWKNIFTGGTWVCFLIHKKFLLMKWMKMKGWPQLLSLACLLLPLYTFCSDNS